VTVRVLISVFIGEAGARFVVSIDDGAVVDSAGGAVTGSERLASDARQSIGTVAAQRRATTVTFTLRIPFPPTANAKAQLTFDLKADLLTVLRVRILRIPDTAFTLTPVGPPRDAPPGAPPFVSVTFTITAADSKDPSDRRSV
jgi:hypothetical protein